MRGKGITYDTGFLSAGTSTREPFEPDVVRREMRIIRDDLHCNAVRVTGGDPHRLKIAATHAANSGLEVWLCPFTNGLTQDALLDLLAECAEHAERLRRNEAEVVMLTGSELSLFTLGFLPGETLAERLALVADPLRVRPMIGEVRARINDFLRRAVNVVRARFGGPVSYASLPLEGVDWAPFDVIATDAAYRTAATAAHFRENIRAFVAQGPRTGQARRDHGVRMYDTSRRGRWRQRLAGRRRDDRVGRRRPSCAAEWRVRSRRGRAGDVSARSPGGVRGRGRRQRVREHLRAL